MPDSSLNWWSVALRGLKPPPVGWRTCTIGGLFFYRKLSRSCPVSLGRGLLKLGLKSVAWAVDSDNLSMAKQAIENGAGGRHIAEQFAPFFDRPVRGHHGGAVFVAAHDDLQEDFAAFWGKDLESHVINDKEVRFEVFIEQAAFPGLRFLGKQLAHQIEDRTVKDDKAGLERFQTDGLDQVTFSDARRAHQKHIPALAYEVTGSQFIDLGAVDARIKAEVEVFQATLFTEVRPLVTAGDHALVTHIDFVLQE